MAKVVLTIEDDEDGVRLSLEMTPGVHRGVESTQAQILGMAAMEYAKKTMIENGSRVEDVKAYGVKDDGTKVLDDELTDRQISSCSDYAVGAEGEN